MKVFGVIGWKNAGKTGLMERLVAEFTARGLSVSTLKHVHHGFDIDRPGKDSFRHRQAGACEVLLASRQRWALMHEVRDTQEKPLAELLDKLEPCDLVLIEGYKRDSHPKIEAHRAGAGQRLIAPGDPSVRAIASDGPLEGIDLPRFDLDDTSGVADFIARELGLVPAREASGPARLENDCFAHPAGDRQASVEEALARLRAAMRPVCATEMVDVPAALGRVLARDHLALRANPPGANCAVDGYGFAFASLPEGGGELELVEGRAAAGAPYHGTVAPGSAIRILTGALVPAGVDSVVMEEDVTLTGGRLRIGGMVRRGANLRAAGEDMAKGALALQSGQVIRPPDIALLSALGHGEAEVHSRLRVGVLSTGDELAAPGSTADPARTYDANRPMLLSLALGWGHEPVDLGHVADDRAALRAALNAAVGRADVILTSGGASAGDEDHVSALLSEEGRLDTWRVAMKPGRPLALAMWEGVPIFGLPGNPVAALVCAMIFARPALSVMAGAGWVEPRAMELPAAFAKEKKAGRREYLRARIAPDGRAEAFASEGSGRISGLSWADGLIELPEAAMRIAPGDPVRFLPYASFGI